jgi:hypothetical protein
MSTAVLIALTTAIGTAGYLGIFVAAQVVVHVRHKRGLAYLADVAARHVGRHRR